MEGGRTPVEIEQETVNNDITNLFLEYVMLARAEFHPDTGEETEEERYKETHGNSLVLKLIEENSTFEENLTIVIPRSEPTPQTLRTREITGKDPKKLLFKSQVSKMVERLVRIGRAYSTFAQSNQEMGWSLKEMGWSLEEHFRMQANILLDYLAANHKFMKDWQGLITKFWPPLKEHEKIYNFLFSSKKVGPLSDAKVSGRNDESANSEEETFLFL